MKELLLEILSEEIPARMQLKAKEQLKNLFIEIAKKNNMVYKHIETYVSARRLVLHAEGVEINKDSNQEIKGPRTDANIEAVRGFAKKYNKNIEDLEKRSTDKGEFYFLVNNNLNANLAEIITDTVHNIFKNFSWPKSMRWGSYNETWVRPIRNILFLFDGKVMPFTFAGVKANRFSTGHRYLGNQQFEVRYFADYQENLKKHHVMLDFTAKMNFIEQEISKIITGLGLVLKPDAKLLEEVAGLVEYPLVLVGTFDKNFLKIPAEILVTTMKSHQRYFPLYTRDGKLSEKFIIISNSKSEAANKIIEGNQKVISARFSDAKFFYEQDLMVSLKDQVENLRKITFHEKLGTMEDKSRRITNLSLFIAMWVPNSKLEQVELAAQICKADLVTNIVSEFPELQGFIGKTYANIQGYGEEVSQAIEDHYLPIGPESRCPVLPESICLALADKFDSLVGFFGIGEAPTSSKDPFALRRSALGIIRIILENNIILPIKLVLDTALTLYPSKYFKEENTSIQSKYSKIKEEILDFILDRFKFYKKSQDVRLDVFEAVTSVKESDNLFLINKKITSLEEILKDNKLIDVIKVLIRLTSILESNNTRKAKVNNSLFEFEEEKELFEIINEIKPDIIKEYKEYNYKKMFEIMYELVNPINNFFDKVIVNDDREKIKNNRIALLKEISEVVEDFANFSLINMRS